MRSENEAQKLAPGASGPPRGDLALRWSPMDDDVQRRRERQGVPMPQGTGNFLRVAGNNAPTQGVTVSAGGGEATCRLAG